MSNMSDQAYQRLAGQAAIITGANTEVAACIALALAKQGVQMCLVGSQPDLLEIATHAVQSAGGISFSVLSDLETIEQAESVVAQTRQKLGRLDMLLLVSPMWGGGWIHEHAVKTWDTVVSANLRQAFLMARVVLPILRAQNYGEVMAIGSDSGLGYYPQDGAYGVAMHGLIALMELIRVENQEQGIRTHILCPGVASTCDVDAEGKPNLTAMEVADWVVWLLTRPMHLRPNGPILI